MKTINKELIQALRTVVECATHCFLNPVDEIEYPCRHSIEDVLSGKVFLVDKQGTNVAITDNTGGVIDSYITANMKCGECGKSVSVKIEEYK